MALGLLRKEQRHIVTSVAERLHPVATFPNVELKNVQLCSTGYERDEEESLYITPLPSTCVRDSNEDSTISDALPCGENSHQKCNEALHQSRRSHENPKQN